MLERIHDSLPAVPPPAETIDALGLPPGMVSDLVLRYLREHGSGSLADLRSALKLSYHVADEVFQELRKRQLVEMKSTLGADFFFALTGAGQQYAAERSKSCRYAGPAPVPLEQYTRIVRAQRGFDMPTEQTLRESFAELVLTDKMIRQVGQAFASGRPIFLYGPPGNGKTSLLERFGRVFRDSVLIPYAIEIDGQIVKLHDPWCHRPTGEKEPEPLDERWLRCYRPRVLAAGELSSAMLNLRLDETTGIYQAPVQMKANNGVLLIDDFGRQAIEPRELLNRWILPLDRRVDYLSLQYGRSFQTPFELVVAFATNLDPMSLADEAFLRRVPNKIYIQPVSDQVFDCIFERVLAQRNLPFDPAIAEYMRELCHTRNPNGLRACYPRDLLEIVEASARFDGRRVEVTRESIDAAVDSYFTYNPNRARVGRRIVRGGSRRIPMLLCPPLR